MRELEQGGVQHLTIRLDLPASPAAAASRSVDHVAEHRHPDLREMETDLVLAPGLELELEQRRVTEALAHPPARARRKRRLAGTRDAPPARDVLGVDR